MPTLRLCRAGQGFGLCRGAEGSGVAAQTLLLAFQLAHVNARKISSWLDSLPGLNGKPRRRSRRKTKNLGTWTPRGYIEVDPAA